MSKRFLEIDFIRGIGIILMVIFHFVFQMTFLGLSNVDAWSGGWLVMARVVQFIFVFSTGMTLKISYDRRSKDKNKPVKSKLMHAGKIFALGMVITLITWILFRDQFVVFGILHFYGAAIVLGLPFLKLKPILNALFGILIFAITGPVINLDYSNNIFFPIGGFREDFITLDYFPLLPWFGLFLMGVAFAGWFYKNGVGRFNFEFTEESKVIRAFNAFGRWSLWIYMIHHAVIYGILNLWILIK